MCMCTSIYQSCPGGSCKSCHTGCDVIWKGGGGGGGGGDHVIHMSWGII